MPILLIQRYVSRCSINSDAFSSDTSEVILDETVLSRLKVTKAVLHDMTSIYENDISNIALPFKKDSYKAWDSSSSFCRSCTHLMSPPEKSTVYPNGIDAAKTDETDLQHICVYYLPSAISTCENCKKRYFRVLN